jgi:hypothetical protein
VVVLVDHSRDGTFPADRSQAGRVPGGLLLHIRGPLLPGLVRPVAVVMGHVLAEHQGQVALAGDQDPVQQLAAEGPGDAPADGIRGVFGTVVMIRSPPDLNTSPNAAVKTRSRS